MPEWLRRPPRILYRVLVWDEDEMYINPADVLRVTPINQGMGYEVELRGSTLRPFGIIRKSPGTEEFLRALGVL